MSKMKDLYIEIEDLLMDEMPVDRIVEKTGVPLAWVLEVKYNLIQDAMENIGCETMQQSMPNGVVAEGMVVVLSIIAK